MFSTELKTHMYILKTYRINGSDVIRIDIIHHTDVIRIDSTWIGGCSSSNGFLGTSFTKR